VTYFQVSQQLSPLLWFPLLTDILVSGQHNTSFAIHQFINSRDGGRRDHMVVGFTTTCAISAYHR
jgi:hypothetical protein